VVSGGGQEREKNNTSKATEEAGHRYLKNKIHNGGETRRGQEKHSQHLLDVCRHKMNNKNMKQASTKISVRELKGKNERR